MIEFIGIILLGKKTSVRLSKYGDDYEIYDYGKIKSLTRPNFSV